MSKANELMSSPCLMHNCLTEKIDLIETCAKMNNTLSNIQKGNAPLLHWRDTLLLLDPLFDAINGVSWLNIYLNFLPS